MKASTISRRVPAIVGGLGLAIAFALAGCGGGGGGGGFAIGGVGGAGAGGDTGSSGGNIPASALSSVDALVAYAKSLVTTALDENEPVNLGDAVAPVSDSVEAVDL